MTTRLSVNINDETEEALRILAERMGTTATDVVRRAISLYKFVDDETAIKKQELQLRAQDDRITAIRLL